MEADSIYIRRIREASELMPMRMEVLRCVFGIAEDADLSALVRANSEYYRRHLYDGSHIACLAYVDGALAGCGGVCLSEEMPSPDNPQGSCAYLMNIYTRPGYRNRGVGHAVVEWLVSEARRRGAGKIYLESTAAGAPVYASLGFEPMEGMMKLQSGQMCKKTLN